MKFITSHALQLYSAEQLMTTSGNDKETEEVPSKEPPEQQEFYRIAETSEKVADNPTERMVLAEDLSLQVPADANVFIFDPGKRNRRGRWLFLRQLQRAPIVFFI